MKTYIVRRGDTLTRIAQMHGMSLNDILDLNPDIDNPNLIRVNQRINVKAEYGIGKQTSFVGTWEGTAEDLSNMFIRTNPDQAERAIRIAPYYVKWGKIFNLRADLAWPQMCHETGFLRFRGDVRPEQNNFVGIGATGGVPGNSFETEELGVIAQFAHLAWYYFEDHVNKWCSQEYDPRHFGNTHYKYTGDTSLDFLSGQWAVPGRYRQPDGSIITYGGQIARTASRIHISTPADSIVDTVKNMYYDMIMKQDRYNWEYIAIHHTVSSQTKTTMDQIKRWHLARGFLREGYNYGINGAGKVEVGRPLDMSGAHVRGWNSKAIGIALYGDFRYDTLTKAQQNSAIKLIHAIQEKYPIKEVLGHNEFSGQATLCPVIDMDKFRKLL